MGAVETGQQLCDDEGACGCGSCCSIVLTTSDSWWCCPVPHVDPTAVANCPTPSLLPVLLP